MERYVTPATHDRPLASKGLLSYRCHGAFGWIMIGAKDSSNAWLEAQRSSNRADRSTLQVWDAGLIATFPSPLVGRVER